MDAPITPDPEILRGYLALLQCLLPEIKVTTMRQLSQIITAMLAMSGRGTMLGISRWTLSGGSYRTVIRFFWTVIPWATNGVLGVFSAAFVLPK